MSGEFDHAAISSAVDELITASHMRAQEWSTAARAGSPLSPFDGVHSHAALDGAEIAVGHKLPVDHRWFLSTLGSSSALSWAVPMPNSVETAPLAQLLSPWWVEHAHAEFGDSYTSSPYIDEISAFDEWHRDLVPIAGSAADPPYFWYCFDFRWNSTNPPIVRFVEDTVFGDGDVQYALGWIAGSFTDLMLQLQCVDEPFAQLPELSPPLTDDAVRWYEERNRQLGLPHDAR